MLLECPARRAKYKHVHTSSCDGSHSPQVKQTVASYIVMATEHVVRHLTLAPDAAFTYQQLFEPQPDGVPLLLKVWGGPAQAKAKLQEGFRSGVLRPADVTASQLALLQRLPNEEAAASVAEKFCAKLSAMCWRSHDADDSKAGHLVWLCMRLFAVN
jgi:hypothetical protein